MQKAQENTTEENTSMDDLKLEAEVNVKEISVEEDILGTQSLLLSESDNDVNDDSTSKTNTSPQKKIISKRSKRILDSDSEDENNFATEEETLTTRNKKKVLTLNDSDSDVDKKDLEEKEHLTELSIRAEDLNTNKQKDVNKREYENLPQKKLGSDSDSYFSKVSAQSLIKVVEDSERVKECNETKKMFSLVDSESSDAESEKEINVSDLESSARDANFEENKEEQNPKANDIKSKVVRASAKKALDEMQAIQSEQQRLHREAQISIPYHKPRKHTLDEFLKRRTVIQPQTTSPVGMAIQTRNLKMTSEELEEYAKLMEERAKEATEFFKSESENEDEDENFFKDNDGVLDKPAEITPNKANEIAHEENTDTNNKIENKLTENLHGNKLTEEELRELLAEEEHMTYVAEKEQERPTCSKVLITEVIELPKLDMNTVRISPLQKPTPRLLLKIKQLLATKNLSGSPTLSGDPNKLIDLETGDLVDKNSTGMENLMKRLMSSVKIKKAKNLETCNILSVENGKLEMSKVNVSRTETKEVIKDAKPGAAYFELKRNLKEVIRRKRLEEINKKQEDELEYSKCLADEDTDDNNEEEDECEVIYTEEYEENDKNFKKEDVMVDEGKNAVFIKDACDKEHESDNDFEIGAYDEDCNSEDDDDEDEEENDDAENNEEENDDGNNIEFVDKSQRKNRIIKAFEDTDDEEEGVNDDIDFLKTQPPTTQLSLCETQASVKTSLEDEENELMALCSGTFGESQKTNINALMSQIPLTQNSGKPMNEEKLMELCSGTFDLLPENVQLTQFEEISEHNKISNKIVSSDEENDEEQVNKNEEHKQRIKKLTKKVRKQKAKLGFSDDEDDEEVKSKYEEDDEKVEQLDDKLELDDEPEIFVDYDSEENEILVQMTKKDKVKQAKNFFENEAELSESEWGSADEDENNLDKYDIELGDEDEFDREKLRTELGQIHARKMLDEDIRDVRKIQEMLFEDEEKDGVGRQRTFKWKNAESGFSLDDGRAVNDTAGDGQNDESGDEINEHQWRKIRYEREQFLKEQGIKPHSQDMSPVLRNNSIKINETTATSAVAMKKLQIITTNKIAHSTSDANRVSPFLISKGFSAMHKKSVRGSFLERDKETLTKLAGLTKGTLSSIGLSDMDNTAGTVSVKTIKPKNFVFATLTEAEHEDLKRKADDLLNSSNENGKNFMKKPKMEPRRDKCFIDQLL